RLDAEALDIHRGPMPERLAAPHRVNASDEAAEPFERALVLQIGRASAAARIDREGEAGVVMQRAAVEDERRDHRNLGLRQYLRKSVFFEDLRITPARRP